MQEREYSIPELRDMIMLPPYHPINTYQNKAIHEITGIQKLPGEVFRIGVLELRDIFSDEKCYFEIEGSNFGRVKFRNAILPQFIDNQNTEHKDLLYVKIAKEQRVFGAYVHCVIAGLWCKRDASRKSEVHHISNNGFDNKPSNLIWIDARTKLSFGIGA